MRFLTSRLAALIAVALIIGCDDRSSSSPSTPTAKESKTIPPITVKNPFDNASFSWTDYNDLGQIEGAVRCSSTGVGTIGWKIYDSGGTILDDYARYPVYIKSGESKKITLFSNTTDLSKAAKVVITVNEEE